MYCQLEILYTKAALIEWNSSHTHNMAILSFELHIVQTQNQMILSIIRFQAVPHGIY